MVKRLRRVCITGGAGFIGSHLVDECVKRGMQVSVIDNLSVGKKDFIAPHIQSGTIEFIRADILDPYLLKVALGGAEVVYHLAANPDARWGLEDPSIDLELDVITTFQVLEGMRKLKIPRIVLASSGTVYGDVGTLEVDEKYGPCRPISLYGAGKLAAEGFVSAYTESFGIQGVICRFGNVIGARATHGALYDFANKLRADPSVLEVLGNGKQAKPYINVKDLVGALTFIADKAKGPFETYNIAPTGATTVEFLAKTLLKELGLKKTGIKTGDTAGGWRGDIPQSRMNSRKLADLGWSPRYTSDQAVEAGVKAFVRNLRSK
jgi:UDP-glucose 4-epimerase